MGGAPLTTYDIFGFGSVAHCQCYNNAKFASSLVHCGLNDHDTIEHLMNAVWV